MSAAVISIGNLAGLEWYTRLGRAGVVCSGLGAMTGSFPQPLAQLLTHHPAQPDLIVTNPQDMAAFSRQPADVNSILVIGAGRLLGQVQSERLSQDEIFEQILWRIRGGRVEHPGGAQQYAGVLRLLGSATSTPDPFSILGLERDASIADARQAYRELLFQYHPEQFHGAGVKILAVATRETERLQWAMSQIRHLYTAPAFEGVIP